jgi:hypothetical protein
VKPIQCNNPDCLFELECDTCITSFHMVHITKSFLDTLRIKQASTLDSFIEPSTQRSPP